MRVQTKLMLSIFPILLIGFLSLSLLSYFSARDVMHSDAFRYIDTVLEARFDDTLQRRAELLRSSKMDKVSSFLTLYQQEALDDLTVGSDSNYGCFMVFDQKGNMLFNSGDCATESLLSQFRSSVLKAVTDPAHKNFGHTHDGPPRVFGARYFEPWNWVLVYSTETAGFEKAIDRILAQTLGLAILCVVACALVIIIVFRKIFGLPVERLKAAAARIAKREPNVVIEIDSKDELGDLSVSLNEMAAAISNYIESLRKSEDSLTRAANAGNVGLWDWDLLIGKVFFSPEWKKQIGYEGHELEGRYEEWESRLHPDDLAATMSVLKASQAPPWPPYKVEFRLRHKDGSYRWISAMGALDFDEQNQPVRMMGTHADITERKQAEEEKAQLEAQLFQAQKMEAIGTLAGGIAHDFNNILAAIMGYTEMAMAEDQNEIRKQYLQQSLNGAIRARNLVKQILTFSRRDDHEKKPMDIKFLLKEAVNFLRASIPTSIEIRQQITKESCNILAHPAQIHQIVMNLCTNATHAMKQKGGILKIELTALDIVEGDLPNYPDLQPGHYVKLTVSDTGHGIDPNIIHRIFDPFFTTKSKDEGTGLGLSVVYGIVKSHDGGISVYSEAGQGAVFNVYLPNIVQAETMQGDMDKPVIGGTERILFVDDEPAIVNIGTHMLSSIGYNATGVLSSAEALNLFQTEPQLFDLVITDMTLPKMNGIDLSREMLRIRPDIPIILCSGLREPGTEKQAKFLGIRAYLTKPLTMRELSQITRDVLDEKESHFS